MGTEYSSEPTHQSPSAANEGSGCWPGRVSMNGKANTESATRVEDEAITRLKNEIAIALDFGAETNPTTQSAADYLIHCIEKDRRLGELNADPLGWCDVENGPDVSVYLHEIRELAAAIVNESKWGDTNGALAFGIKMAVDRIEACLTIPWNDSRKEGRP